MTARPTMNARSVRYHGSNSFSPSPRRPRQQAMTYGERAVVDQMFTNIFNKNEAATSGGADTDVGFGQPRSPALDALFRKMQRYTRTQRWANEMDEQLDKKKEEMELCETDLQLLEWAMREVFGESQRYEAAARRASASAFADPSPPAPAPTPTATSPITSPDPTPEYLQPPAYPHLLAALMRTFRDKYRYPCLLLMLW